MQRMLMLLGMTVLGLASAQAQITVSQGSGPGQECYRHARFGFDPIAGIKACDLALEQVLTISDRAATYDNRGVILNQAGRSDEAGEDFAKAIALQPDLGDPYINSGSVLIKKKLYEDALVQINKGLALGVSMPQVGYYDRALEGAGDRAEFPPGERAAQGLCRHARASQSPRLRPSAMNLKRSRFLACPGAFDHRRECGFQIACKYDAIEQRLCCQLLFQFLPETVQAHWALCQRACQRLVGLQIIGDQFRQVERF